MTDMEIASGSQGKVTGVIIPPPDIRAVVDKTAQFVARNGKSFEQRILNSGEGKTAKFNFLKAYDPYNAYYEMKIKEFEDGIISPENKTSVESKSDQDKESNNTPATQKCYIFNFFHFLPSPIKSLKYIN
jgi:hypothetical protein